MRGKRYLRSYDQEIKSLPDGAGSRPVLVLKAHQWFLSPEGGGSCPRGCSQVLKQLPPLLELQSCREAGMGSKAQWGEASSVVPKGISGDPGTHSLGCRLQAIRYSVLCL